MSSSIVAEKSKEKLKRNVISLTVVQIATYILPLISVPIVSRIIGPEKFGIINFSAAFTTYFTLLISYGFDFTATRKIAKFQNDAEKRNVIFNEVFWTQMFLFALSSIIFTLALIFIPMLKNNIVVSIASYSVCISLVFTQNWLYQGMQDLSKLALFSLTSRLLFTIFILLTIKTSSDYVWQPILIGIIQTSVAFVSFFWAMKTYKLKLIPVSPRRCLEILWEERTIFISLIFVNLYSSTSTIILGIFQTQEQVGYYTAGQKLIIIAQSVLTMPLAQAFYPYIARAFSESQEQGLQIAHKLTPIILAFLGAASICMFVLGPTVISLFYGKDFENSIHVFQILTIVPLLFSLNNLFGVQIMLNLKMDRQFLSISAMAAVVSIVLNLILIRKWGYIGTTVSWLATEIFILISMYSSLLRHGIKPIDTAYLKWSFLVQYISNYKSKAL